ncbi:hypothetical protein HHL22_01015 [Hymenobacter sp. RP-2-7]|uniref:DUF4136 domain-containing protein n=1 Tax=Hymenobacter polaris TaxID=2682546 RepID=A0A7Y0FKJ6_9BACT|nr:hypothetical protein [Hymenobacter polaris]NML63777.1 hypothetical protein [Hymenobacter polaris]
MRTLFVLLIACILLPLCAQAQSTAEAGDYYILKENPGVKITTWFSYVSCNELLATSKYGKKYTLKAQYVTSLRWKQRSFLTVSGFEIRKVLTKAIVDYGFAEVLDTGRVTLLRYDYAVGIPLVLPIGSRILAGSYQDPRYVYLLRDSTGTAAIPVFAHHAREQRAALRPYVASRPDLVAALESKRFNENSLPAIIRSLNSGQPFTPPEPPAVYLGID